MKKQAINNKRQSINKAVKILPLHYWIIWLAFAFAIFALVVWGIWGSVYTHVSGVGMLLPGNKHIYTANALGAGNVLQLTVQPGDTVKKDQIVAYVDQGRLQKQITQKLETVKLLREQKEKLLAEQKLEANTLESYYLDVLTTLSKEKEYVGDYQKFLNNLLTSESKVVEKGYISKLEHEKNQQTYFETLNRLREINNNILQTQYYKEKEKSEWEIRINEVDLQLIAALNDLELTKLDYEAATTVKSPVDGTVIAILAGKGGFVSMGDNVISIVDKDSNLHLLAFFQPTDGKKIKPGMRAFVSPTYINKYMHGSIIGVVRSISDYPLTRKAVKAEVANEDFVKEFNDKDYAFLLAAIDLKKDPNDPSLFKWTNKNKEPIKVTPGSICQVEVEIKRYAPITLIIPFLRKWLDIQ